ncbi:MAG TPA: AAA family ATPase [Candidatus Nanoarchaeia archaeon]|nr:AAA family ATPase [Candidatus Nanoarchaeia archaeon]
MSKGKAVGIVSVKGGVGKTTTVLNLAYILANLHNKKVAVIDANFSSPNISLHLGSLDHDKHLHDVLNNKSKLQEAVYEHPLGFHVVPADIQNQLTKHENLKNAVNKLKASYDIILLDSSPTLNSEMAAALIASDEVYIVSTPDIPTLTTTLKTAKAARENNTKVAGLILNKVRNKDYELKPESMERLTGLKLSAVIRDDVRVLEALNKVNPIAKLSPNSSVSEQYKKLAANIIGANYVEPKWHQKAVAAIKDDFVNLTTHKFSKGLNYYK